MVESSPAPVDGTVKVWDLNSGQEQRTLSGHGGVVNALALTGDGRVVSGSDDGTVKVWDLNSGQEQRTLSGHGRWGHGVGVDGRWSSRLRLQRWHGEGVGPDQRPCTSERCRDMAVGSRRWR